MERKLYNLERAVIKCLELAPAKESLFSAEHTRPISVENAKKENEIIYASFMVHEEICKIVVDASTVSLEGLGVVSFHTRSAGYRNFVLDSESDLAEIEAVAKSMDFRVLLLLRYRTARFETEDFIKHDPEKGAVFTLNSRGMSLMHLREKVGKVTAAGILRGLRDNVRHIEETENDSALLRVTDFQPHGGKVFYFTSRAAAEAAAAEFEAGIDRVAPRPIRRKVCFVGKACVEHIKPYMTLVHPATSTGQVTLFTAMIETIDWLQMVSRFEPQQLLDAITEVEASHGHPMDTCVAFWWHVTMRLSTLEEEPPLNPRFVCFAVAKLMVDYCGHFPVKENWDVSCRK